jgi:hypothetical protein
MQLQRFIDDRFLVVTEAASDAKSSRNNDCESYKDTHHSIPGGVGIGQVRCSHKLVKIYRKFG